jgi:hypothetical protein
VAAYRAATYESTHATVSETRSCVCDRRRTWIFHVDMHGVAGAGTTVPHRGGDPEESIWTLAERC